MAIILTNKSQETGNLVKLVGDKLLFSRTIYQHLGSLNKNRNLVSDYEADLLPKKYKEILDSLNDLHLKTNYPKLYPDIEVSKDTMELDEYLGSLGLTEVYPYSKDSVFIPDWIAAVNGETKIRILVDTSDETFLIDTSDNTVLVSLVE